MKDSVKFRPNFLLPVPLRYTTSHAKWMSNIYIMPSMMQKLQPSDNSDPKFHLAVVCVTGGSNCMIIGYRNAHKRVPHHTLGISCSSFKWTYSYGKLMAFCWWCNWRQAHDKLVTDIKTTAIVWRESKIWWLIIKILYFHDCILHFGKPITNKGIL